ncbi:MAG: hypothetical protein F6K56_30175 [Moorea sp. SIO3G5]|nr:hypothetical protein [Moorena sp. SIO3G5]
MLTVFIAVLITRLPTPVPLLGGVRGGFRLPFPSWEGLGVGSDSRSPPGRG